MADQEKGVVDRAAQSDISSNDAVGVENDGASLRARKK